MKKVIFTLTTCLFFNLTFGQLKLKGKIQDEKEPLPFVSILLTDSASVQLTTLSDSLGRFSFQLPKAGKYHLLVDYISYEKFEKTLEISEDQEIQVQLAPAKIEEVVVVGQRPQIQRKVDGVVLRWANPAMLKGLTMQDALRRLPMMIRSKNGLPEVVMKNRTVYYFNGKRSFLSNEQIQQLLESLPAEEIESIEVITNPGAEYDEQGNVAVVKIFLKRGSLFSKIYLEASSRQNTFNSQAANFTWVKQSKWNTNLNVSAKRSAYRNITNTEFYENDKSSAMLNYQNMDFRGKLSANGNYIASRQLPKNQEIEIQASANISSTRVEPVIERSDVFYQTWTGSAWQTISQGVQENIKEGQSSLQNLGVFYKKGYSKGFLSTNLVLSNFLSEDFATLIYTSDISYDNRTQNVKQGIQSAYLRTDYTTMLKNSQLAFGFYGAYTLNQTDTKWQNLVGGTYVTDPNNTFRYNYDEQYITPFVSWSKQWSPQWQSKIGIKLENTFNRGKIDDEPKFTNTYINPLPDVSLMYLKSERHIWNFASRGYVVRPDFWQLNPYRFYISPNFYVENNPFLQPSYIVENTLTYTFNQKLTLAAQWRHQTRRESQINLQDGTNNIVTRLNVADENLYTGALNYGEVFWKQRWQMNLGLSGTWVEYLPYAQFADIFYRTNFFFGSANLDNTLLLLQNQKSTLNLNFGIYASTSGYDANMFIKPIYNLYANLTYTIKDWTISLETDDLTRRMVMRGVGLMNSRIFLLNTYGDDRMVRLRVRYVLGSKVVRKQDSNIEKGDIDRRINK
ncbi:outer membrane beta-barrel protein [Raineya orbicola]|uniref:Cna protein B-type domain n=1 Tax=Raineya orbicola TaxID=2016530 RepID=A0A2N3IF11_9BACT|nr:outer membrane beta-barrel protein [Raineya orbicola]PKQ68922.1 Cna protein B-type domain [Raineya orbicola]